MLVMYQTYKKNNQAPFIALILVVIVKTLNFELK